jgi:acyl-CoA thioesterase-2
MDPRLDLPETLALERIEVNLFRGTSPDYSGERIFGGQVIAQSLLAAYETVDDRVCHSLHCYFIRPGDPKIPILFDVDRSRDGGSFTTRRVTAIQHGRQIFNLAASFKVPEKGYEHQAPMPKVPRPDELPDEATQRQMLLEALPPEMHDLLRRPRPIEMRAVGGHHFLLKGKAEPNSNIWMRAVAPVGDDVKMQQVVMAYASDMALAGNALRPHGLLWRTPGLQSASLDHAMWFHHPSDFNRWHLYVMDSPAAAGACGFNRGSIYREDGVLVASTAQEGLMRVREDAAPS